jgi:hypothetical protein
MTDDPRRARRAAGYREDAPLPQHYLDLATGEWVAAIVDWTRRANRSGPKAHGSETTSRPGRRAARWRRCGGNPRRGGAMRPLDAVFEDATALFADASALMHRARGLRQALEAATATGALVQGLEVALQGLASQASR